jgi:hypothetical protein
MTSSLGIVQTCRTSAAVTMIRMNEFNGNVIHLSVSSKQNLLLSSCGIMYKSGSSLVKSEYS